MTIELISLFVFLAIFAALLLAQPLVLAKANGMQYVMGNRDGGTATDHPVLGRLARTVNNSMEAAVLFVPLVLATQVLGVSNTLTRNTGPSPLSARAWHMRCSIRSASRAFARWRGMQALRRWPRWPPGSFSSSRARRRQSGRAFADGCWQMAVEGPPRPDGRRSFAFAERRGAGEWRLGPRDCRSAHAPHHPAQSHLA